MPTSVGNALQITIPLLSDQADIRTALTNLVFGDPNNGGVSSGSTSSELLLAESSLGAAIEDLRVNKANILNPVFTGSIFFEGTSVNDFETQISVVDPTADRVITIPDATTTLVGNNTTDTLSNKTFSGAGAGFAGSTSGVTTLRASAIAGSTTITLPASTGTLVTTGDVGSVTTSMILNGTILDADISSSAAISVAKLSTATSGYILQASGVGVAPAWVDPTTVAVSEADKVGNAVTFVATVGAVPGSQFDGSAVLSVGYGTVGAAGLTADNILTGANTFSGANAFTGSTTMGALNLTSGNVIKINNVQVLSATEYVGNAATVTNGVTAAATLTNSALVKGNGAKGLSTATASDITTAIGTTAVTNATNATNATAGAIYSETSTTTKTGNRKIFVGPNQPDAANAYGQGALQVGDIWIDY